MNKKPWKRSLNAHQDIQKRSEDLTDLARVRGISASIGRWLQESFYIYSVEDLAQFSASAILFKLQDEGENFSRKEVESWIAEAQKLVSQKTPWQSSANFLISLQNRRVGKQLEQRTTVYFIEADKKVTWPGFDFNGVYALILEQLQQSYQQENGKPIMRIYMPQSQAEVMTPDSFRPNVDAEWAEIITDFALLNDPMSDLKIIEQSLQSISPPPPVAMSGDSNNLETPVEDDSSPLSDEVSESAVEGGLATNDGEDEPEVDVRIQLDTESEKLLDDELENPLKLEITHIKIYLPAETKTTEAEDIEGGKAENQNQDSDEDENVIVIDSAKRLLFDHLPQATFFDLEVIFQLTGSGALNLTKQPLPFYTEMYGQNRTTKHKLTLGRAAVGHLVEGELIYVCQVTEVNFLEIGTYQLNIFTRLEGASVSPGFLEVPYVQVA